MFNFFKKKEVIYYCTKCDEEFTQKHLDAKGYTILKCPFCKSSKCYKKG